MPRGKDRKQINVIMAAEDADRLKTLAEKQERSVSQMAAILIREGLERLNVKAVGNDESVA